MLMCGEGHTQEMQFYNPNIMSLQTFFYGFSWYRWYLAGKWSYSLK